MKKRMLLLSFVIAAFSMMYAFSGTITENTQWSDDIIITGDVTVAAGVVLTIDAGVTVSFTRIDANEDGLGDIDFTINGRLLTNGTANNPVIFTSNEDSPVPGDWAGIDFLNTTSVYSILNHTEIYYAVTGVYISDKYVTFNDGMIAYCKGYGMHVLSSHGGLTSLNDLIIFENKLTSGGEGFGFKAESGAIVNADGLIVSANDGYGMVITGTNSCVISNSRAVSNGMNGVYVNNASPQFSNTDISENDDTGLRLVGATSAPEFQYCSISYNDGFGVAYEDGCDGSIIYSNIIENTNSGLIITDNSVPTINYCNIYNNGQNAEAIVEQIPSSSLYSTSGSSSTYYAMFPGYMVSRIHVSGYADHNSSSDTYDFDVYLGGSEVYNYYRYTSSDTSFDLWTTINSSSTSYSWYVNLYTYSVYSQYGRVSAIEYDEDYFTYQLTSTNTSSGIDARFNWWGQVNGVDDLIFQQVASTVNYEGSQVEEVGTAGTTLTNMAPAFTLSTPDSLVLNPSSLSIQWYDIDIEDDAIISLYYDDGHDTTGTLIVGNIHEDSATDYYNWNFANTPHSLYYIYGVIDDGENEPVVSYAPGQVMVGPLSINASDELTGEAGSQITVPIEMINSIDPFEIISFQFTLAFDYTLLTVADIDNDGTLTDGWSINYNDETQGVVTVSGYSTNHLPTDGTLLNIVFDIASDALDFETCQLNFSDTEVNDGARTVTENDGTFTIRNAYTISGLIDYFAPTRVAVDNAKLVLTGYENDSLYTDASGNYSFAQHHAGSYSLNVSSTQAIPELTITPYDASLTARAALGLIIFDANQETAADVNGDYYPTVYDAALMAQYSVGLIDAFDAGIWAFNPSSYAITLGGASIVRNFTGIVIGDPSGNYPGSAERTIPDMWDIGTLARDEAGRVRVNVRFDDAFYSFVSRIDFNQEQFSYAGYEVAGDLEDIQVVANVQNGSIRVAGFATGEVGTAQPVVSFLFDTLEAGDDIDVAYCMFDEAFGGNVEVLAADGEEVVPAKFGISQNYPNPFNPVTTISYDIAKPCDVNIEVYNVKGQKVTTLVNEKKQAGSYKAVWNAENVSSGIYFYRINAGDFHSIRKMILIK